MIPGRLLLQSGPKWPLSQEAAHSKTHTSSMRHYRSVEGVKWRITEWGAVYRGGIGDWKENKGVADEPSSFYIALCHVLLVRSRWPYGVPF